MSLITGLPALIALLVCLRRGATAALLNVYLPTLLLLPEVYRWSFTGHLTFNESAILPIAAFFLLDRRQKWSWSFTDVLVAALVMVMTAAQYMNSGFQEARNVGLNATLCLLFPYMVAKGVLREEDLWSEFAKRFVVVLAIVVTIGLYELAMGVDPFNELLNRFFPGQSQNFGQIRFGLTRTAGPFGHAILAGIIMAVGYRIARWLDWAAMWNGKFGYLPISKVRLGEALIIAGSVMTLSRGPWIAAGVAALIVFVCRAKNRRRAIALAAAASILAGFPLYHAAMSYISTSRLEAQTILQANAAYRWELLERYLPVVEERPVWGWGIGHVPQVGDLSSIDNQYLYLALNYGLGAAALLVAIFFWMAIRLLLRGIQLPRDDPASSLMFTLLGALVVFAISITMSWLGAQTGQVLLLMVGWSESVLSARASAAPT